MLQGLDKFRGGAKPPVSRVHQQAFDASPDAGGLIGGVGAEHDDTH